MLEIWAAEQHLHESVQYRVSCQTPLTPYLAPSYATTTTWKRPRLSLDVHIGALNSGSERVVLYFITNIIILPSSWNHFLTISPPGNHYMGGGFPSETWNVLTWGEYILIIRLSISRTILKCYSSTLNMDRKYACSGSITAWVTSDRGSKELPDMITRSCQSTWVATGSISCRHFKVIFLLHKGSNKSTKQLFR